MAGSVSGTSLSSAYFPDFAMYNVGSSGYHIQSLTQDLAQHPFSSSFVANSNFPGEDAQRGVLILAPLWSSSSEPSTWQSLGLEQFMLLSYCARKLSKQRNGYCTVRFTVRTVEESSSVRPRKAGEATILQLGFSCISSPSLGNPRRDEGIRATVDS